MVPIANLKSVIMMTKKTFIKNSNSHFKNLINIYIKRNIKK